MSRSVASADGSRAERGERDVMKAASVHLRTDDTVLAAVPHTHSASAAKPPFALAIAADAPCAGLRQVPVGSRAHHPFGSPPQLPREVLWTDAIRIVARVSQLAANQKLALGHDQFV